MELFKVGVARALDVRLNGWALDDEGDSIAAIENDDPENHRQRNRVFGHDVRDQRHQERTRRAACRAAERNHEIVARESVCVGTHPIEPRMDNPAAEEENRKADVEFGEKRRVANRAKVPRPVAGERHDDECRPRRETRATVGKCKNVTQEIGGEQPDPEHRQRRDVRAKVRRDGVEEIAGDEGEEEVGDLCVVRCALCLVRGDLCVVRCALCLVRGAGGEEGEENGVDEGERGKEKPLRGERHEALEDERIDDETQQRAEVGDGVELVSAAGEFLYERAVRGEDDVRKRHERNHADECAERGTRVRVLRERGKHAAKMRRRETEPSGRGEEKRRMRPHPRL